MNWLEYTSAQSMLKDGSRSATTLYISDSRSLDSKSKSRSLPVTIAIARAPPVILALGANAYDPGRQIKGGLIGSTM
ncbi:hypothetical protein V500_06314 [Pseudogymnoascus sp. VKM F-4518 (FW-2643)]|nr:hypothetical protein V500_06314 [Pseudogymnoascus sp. VKM F-4518 (FW-2643)]